MAPVARAQTPLSSAEGQCRINGIFGPLTTGGYVAATGFAVDSERGAPVRKVELTLDGVARGDVSLMGLRPDVLTHFGRQDYLWSGWNASASLDGVASGQHSMELVAISHSGKRIPCGRHTIVVSSNRCSDEKSLWRDGVHVLWKTAGLLFWLGFVGLAAALYFGGGPPALHAPLLGLSLFAVASEVGGIVHARPFASAKILTAIAAIALVVVLRKRPLRHWRLHRVFKQAGPALAAAILFALIGVVPTAYHGEDTVLGDIDDAARECTVADSIARYGWNVPADVQGHFSVMRGQWNTANGRMGGVYILAALAEGLDARAHAVYPIAMLATGCLVVLGVGLLSFRVLPARLRWMPPAFAALNSILLATLYGQHLGSLLGAALLVFFLASALTLALSHRVVAAVPVALCLAAVWTLYPESMPVLVFATLFILAASGRLPRLKRNVFRFALAAVLAAAINPVGLARGIRSSRGLTAEPTLSSPYRRMIAGDTHYFPGLNTVTGIRAYRWDAPAPTGKLRSILIPGVTVLVFVVAILGWSRLRWKRRWIVLSLTVPVGLGLMANWLLRFPYGYAKLLPMAAPVWAVAFSILVSPLLERARGRVVHRGRFAVGAVAVGLLFILALPSVRHVVVRAVRAVPSYDPALRSLESLAAVVGRKAVFQIETPSAPYWIVYFLGENAVDLGANAEAFPGASYYRLIDRRGTAAVPLGAIAFSDCFSLVPMPRPGS